MTQATLSPSAQRQPEPPGAPWRRFACDACGLVYDESQGDPDSGLAPGTRFEDIPADWACPVCGVTKADFRELPGLGRGDFARGSSASRPATLGDTGSQGHPHDRDTLTRPTSRPLSRQRAGRGGVVIVGAGHAGWALAESLRESDPRQPITLVTACPGDRYEKPWLSVAHARQQAADALVKETGMAAAQRLGVRLHTDTRALRVHVHAGLLATTRGLLPYDRLVLAHGAEPALPPALSATQCWRVNHLQAYQRLRGVLDGAARDVLIVGAGLVGCELANDLALGGHRVTLVDTQPEPLARWRDQGAGTTLLRSWQDLPIRFIGGVQITGTRVETTSSGASQTVVLTADGRELRADVVVAATGLQTPDRLARSAGLAWNQGIVVDPLTLQTSRPRIHALGDCIAIEGRPSRFIEPIGRQVRTLTAALLERPPVPYEHRAQIVRVKTAACPLTLQ